MSYCFVHARGCMCELLSAMFVIEVVCVLPYVVSVLDVCELPCIMFVLEVVCVSNQVLCLY